MTYIILTHSNPIRFWVTNFKVKPRVKHLYISDWFYHIPAARSKSTASVAIPVQSQIPGLSNVAEDLTDENDRHFKRKWIRDTDSKYVKLAKAGGRKSRSNADTSKNMICVL